MANLCHFSRGTFGALALMLGAVISTNSLAQSCGTANGVMSLSAPTTGLCNAGIASLVNSTTPSGPHFWTCINLFPTFSSVGCQAPAHCHDIDGNGQLHATTDGLMLTRVMLGLKGAAVTSAAQPGAPRNTWPAVRSFLNQSCGHELTCVANGQTISVGVQPDISACINVALPVGASECCAGSATIITYDNPIGTNSCVATCGPPIASAQPNVVSGVQ